MTSAGNHESIEELQQRLGIAFDQQEFLSQALTHRSYLAEVEGTHSNERLEFLGDTVLDLIIAEEIFRVHPDWPEGELTKAKAAAVGERSLETIARRWGLGAYMRISRGEESSGGRERRALLADAVEAVIGAYYLDRGLDACRAFVLREMAPILEVISRKEYHFDFKTQLQEAAQARFQSGPTYAVAGESGPPHARVFTVTVSIADQVIGHGEGRSKKEAEQIAAAEALRSSLLTE